MRGSPSWRVAAAVWAVIIFVSGVLPTESMVRTVSQGHETRTTSVAHFVAYAVLCFLLSAALCGREVRGEGLVAALVLAAALGGAIEMIQGPLPYRDLQLSDFLVDVVGAGLGLAAFSASAVATRSRSRRG